MSYEDFSIAAVKKAGALLLELRREKFETNIKHDNPRDILTSVDTAVNTYLIDEVAKTFPEHSIYSEEESGMERNSRYQWAIDPIDGSANFSRGIPHFAVCLGLLEDGAPIAGAIYNPVTNELFSFTKGGGARFNEAPIHVSDISDLAKSQVIFSPGSRNPELWDWAGSSYRKLLEHTLKRGIYGSSALDVCFVAAGRADIAVYGTLSTLDVASAFGVLYEAGGVASDAKGNSVILSQKPQKVFIANSPGLLTRARELLEN